MRIWNSRGNDIVQSVRRIWWLNSWELYSFVWCYSLWQRKRFGRHIKGKGVGGDINRTSRVRLDSCMKVITMGEDFCPDGGIKLTIQKDSRECGIEDEKILKGDRSSGWIEDQVDSG